jgi:hypothetical protein
LCRVVSDAFSLEGNAMARIDFDERWGKLRRGDLFVEFVYDGFVPYKR